MSLNRKTLKVICGNSKPMIYDGNATKDFEGIKHIVIIDYFKTTYLLKSLSFKLKFLFSLCSVNKCSTFCIF